MNARAAKCRNCAETLFRDGAGIWRHLWSRWHRCDPESRASYADPFRIGRA